jgi:hypothetical protein
MSGRAKCFSNFITENKFDFVGILESNKIVSL